MTSIGMPSGALEANGVAVPKGNDGGKRGSSHSHQPGGGHRVTTLKSNTVTYNNNLLVQMQGSH
jgi:hypothetical protein